MSRVRRDPRTLLAARTVAGQGRRRLSLRPAEAVPGTGRSRRDPRAERRSVSRQANGRLRLDRGSAHDASALQAAAARPEAAPPPPVRVVPQPAFLVMAWLERPDGRLSVADRQLLAAAHLLADADGGAVTAVVVGDGGGLAEAGADRVLSLPSDRLAGYRPEAQAAALVAAIEAYGPRHVLFREDEVGPGDLARRVAARMDERLWPGVQILSRGHATRRGGGGGAALSLPPTRLMTLAEDAVGADGLPLCEGRAIEAPAFTARERLDRGRLLPVDLENVALAEAPFVAAAGNGVTDWPAFNDVAAGLGAVRGGSRVVCDDGHLPRDRQVGASGSPVNATVYLAFGIAGAPQHLQGITAVEHVIAVNTDLHAEMIKRADLAIIADAQEVMPALLDALRREEVR
ncbi:electron transfer flavoprotein subunit alpha/FixB family protein [Marinivivus vitaminiproducens]|uniref:electron transfer flavoprotein subunit alpha/FixB family protein n=1 Tax=Marinivivus vitaminiproducens TaxID=3035935 RepID=UPI0027A0725A|nr:electron transfer flavoprotein subunit alpha/FixB family protein [Geminicoccaceae bacterium SCSIO 64248]